MVKIFKNTVKGFILVKKNFIDLHLHWVISIWCDLLLKAVSQQAIARLSMAATECNPRILENSAKLFKILDVTYQLKRWWNIYSELLQTAIKSGS